MPVNKQWRVHSEIAYFLAIVLLALAVAMMSAADFGVSMIVAPAYILSQKIAWLTFGQAEYVIQGVLFIAFCLLMKRVRAVYFSSFITGLIYGAVLDGWRLIVPHFNPSVTPPGSLPWEIKIAYFIIGMVLTSFSIALFFHTYLYPQVYDFFVKGVSGHYGINRTRFKQVFDLSFLIISVVFSLTLFGGFVGVGVGTLIVTVCNGPLIGLFDRWMARHIRFVPFFPRFASRFVLQ